MVVALYDNSLLHEVHNGYNSSRLCTGTPTCSLRYDTRQVRLWRLELDSLLFSVIRTPDLHVAAAGVADLPVPVSFLFLHTKPLHFYILLVWLFATVFATASQVRRNGDQPANL